MTVTDEQAKNIKEQILRKVETFPEDKQEGIKNYIISLDNEELEEFLIKNNLIKTGEGEDSSKEEKTDCIMCMISSKQIESLVIYEDADYLAALEINPLSEGHIILIPKKHIKETKSLEAKAFSLADKIGKHVVKQLNAENFQMSSSDELKHAIINIIPKYKGQKNLERKPADKKHLQELAIKIGEIKKPNKKSPKKEKKPEKLDQEKVKEALIKLPRRIP